MATIFPRKNADGSITWRLQIRRVGIKPFHAAFLSREDAKEFARLYEQKYVLDPENFPYDALLAKREREFARL